MKQFLEQYLFHFQLMLVVILWIYMGVYIYDAIKQKTR
jgi:hypothetical protein